MGENELMSLHAQLDTLWEDYLTALDIYTTSQKEVSGVLASGYFALAQANARRTNGRRYGRDWYDERSKATARVQIHRGEYHSSSGKQAKDDLTLNVHEVPIYLDATSDSSSVPKKTVQSERSSSAMQPLPQHSGTEAKAMLPTPSATPEPTASDSAAGDGTPVDTRKLQPDPASWYGLFVSPSLRHTQSVFRGAILGQLDVHDSVNDDENESHCHQPLQAAVNAARTLRLLEVEIRATRKAIRRAGG